MTTQIGITQIGLCTPLGHSPQEVLTKLLQGDTSAMQLRDDLLFSRPTLVGAVDNAHLLTLPEPLTPFNCRNNRLLHTAAVQIQTYVEQAKARYGANRIGVILGSSTSGISKGEAALRFRAQHGHFPPSFHYSQQELGSASLYLKTLFGLESFCYTISTACSSSAKVFASAKRMLNAGLCDMVIVGGVDSLCQLTLNGFDALESVAEKACNPFSKNRDGINIGEGAILFTLEREQAPVMLAGVGESSDAYHISAPHPEGDGAISAMQLALADAQISADKIDYINLHGTATPKNDAMESRAVTQVFETVPPCSSTKPLVGHLLGAAGAIEAAFAYLLLSDFNSDNGLPPQVWDQQTSDQDPVLPLVKHQDRQSQLNYIMSNSFAFGGSNASIIFARCQKA